MRWIPRFPPVCAQHNTRSTLDADILKAHGTDEETKMASRHLSVHLSSSSLPFLFHLAAGKQPWIRRLSPTRHNGRSFKTREPIFAFVSRDSAPPLSHSTSQRSQRPTRQRGWQSGTERRRWDFFSPFPWRTNKTVRVVARVKRHEIRWPFFFTNHCSLLHEFIRYLSRYLTIYVRLCINYSFEKENGVTCYTLHIRVNKCKFFYA